MPGCPPSRRDPGDPQRSGGLTRRGLLVAGAGALGAQALARLPLPAPALAAPAALTLLSLDLGRLSAATTRTVTAGRSFDLAGLQWSGPQHVRLALRSRRGDGPWSGWIDASDHGHTPAVAERGGPGSFGEPVWTGAADQLQLRASADLRGVRLHLIDAQGPSGALPAASAALPLAQPVLDAGPGQPPIIARDAWAHGLRGILQTYGSMHLAFVHHTQNLNGYARAQVPAMLRAIYAFHRYVRGWKDIGYNFLIDRFGRIWEGRLGGIDEPLVGAQAGGFNTASTGVAVLGDYTAQRISPAARQALTRLLAWKLSLHGLPVRGRISVLVDPAGAGYSRFPADALVSLPRVAGHRDGDSTDCPGDALYGQLETIRREAAALAGRPVRTTLDADSAIIAPGPAILSGKLAFLDGTAPPPLTVQLQVRQAPGASPRELTVLQAATDVTGAFSVQLPVAYNLTLRALFAGDGVQPASVSDPLDVGVIPALTLQVANAGPPSGSPAQLSGTVNPAKARVRLLVWAVDATGAISRIAQQTVDGSSGQFATAVLLPGPGQYRFQADTKADSRNLAATSLPVDVVVSG